MNMTPQIAVPTAANTTRIPVCASHRTGPFLRRDSSPCQGMKFARLPMQAPKIAAAKKSFSMRDTPRYPDREIDMIGYRTATQVVAARVRPSAAQFTLSGLRSQGTRGSRTSMIDHYFPVWHPTQPVWEAGSVFVSSQVVARLA